MLGYMTKKEALKNGFTHHGSYYGIPLWITDEACPLVATKWLPMELFMSLFHHIEGTMVVLMQEQPGFRFMIGRKIE